MSFLFLRIYLPLYTPDAWYQVTLLALPQLSRLFPRLPHVLWVILVCESVIRQSPVPSCTYDMQVMLCTRSQEAA